MAWAPDYISLADLKGYQRIPLSDTQDDTELALDISAASRAVDRATRRQFGTVAAPEARTYEGEWSKTLGAYAYVIDDVIDTDDMVAMSGTTEIIDFTLRPTNAIQVGKAHELLVTPISGELLIEAKWGWPAIPPTVKRATRLQAARFAIRRESPYGIAGSPSDGTEQRLLATVDPDVKVMLKYYRREWWAQ